MEAQVATRIIRNSFHRAAGFAVGSILQFAAIVLIARYLGVEGFGQFSFILALANVFQLVADMGVRNILIRDLAVDRASLTERLGVARSVLMALSVGSTIAIIGLVNALEVSEEVREAFYIASFAVVVTFYGLGYSAVLRAFEELDADILGFVGHKVVLVLLVCLLMPSAIGLRGVFGAILVANGFQTLYCRTLVRRRHGGNRMRFDLRASRALLRESAPLGIAELLRGLTWQLGRLLLAALATEAAVGLYSTGCKFAEALSLLSMNLTLPLFPLLARLAQSSRTAFFDSYLRSLKVLEAVGFPFALILFMFSDRIVVVLFGASYGEAAAVLRVLAPMLAILPLSSLYGYGFTALHRQGLYTVCVGFALAINFGLDLFLIPSAGAVGAAMATVVGESALFLCCLGCFWRLGGRPPLLGAVWRPLVAATGMAVVCWWVKDAVLVSLVVGTLLGVSVYVCILFLLNTFDQGEIAVLREVVQGWVKA